MTATTTTCHSEPVEESLSLPAGWVTCPYPPLAEQERIVAEVERRLSVVELRGRHARLRGLSALVESNWKRADRLRQSILQRAFEGKLVE
jgi:type I restriction enzyme S subunit